MQRTIRIIATAAVGTGLALGALGTAAAQDARWVSSETPYCELYRGLSRVIPSECASAEEIAAQTPQPGALTRGIRWESEVEVSAVEQSEPPPEFAIAMQVKFEFDSSRLDREARVVLDRLAGVLTDELMQTTVIEIEGHADAHGPDDYNLDLSQQRAAAVRAYLIEQHGIRAERLPFSGKGESEPYDPANPFAGVNRRVEFHNLSG